MRDAARCQTLAFGLAALTLLAACSDDEPAPTEPEPGPDPEPEVAAVEVEPSEVTFSEEGETTTLDAVARDADGEEITADADDFAWSTSAADVAEVDDSGVVTASATGQTSVTAELDGESGAAEIRVMPPAASVALAERSVGLELSGSPAALEATAWDADGTELPTRPEDFTWESTNPAVASTDASGTVTGAATNQAAITVALDGEADHALATVTDPSPDPVSDWDEVESPVVVRLWDLWGSEPTEVWAVGFGDGTVLRYSGTAWSEVASPTDDWLRGLWGSGSDDIWAVGNAGTILHFDGADWNEAASPTASALQDVWGSGPDDVWAVGSDGTITHFDGTVWGERVSPTDQLLLGVWGSGPDDVWAVGGSFETEESTILHFDGSGWTEVASPADASVLLDIWGSGPENAWAVGEEGVILHYDGTGWSEVASPTDSRLRGLWGSGPDDVWAVGSEGLHYYNGAAWSSVETPTEESLTAVWGMSPGDVWGVGFEGTIVHGAR